MSKIKKLQEEYEYIIKKFQTFCLNPNNEDFKLIIECKKLQINEGDDYNIWLYAVINKHPEFMKYINESCVNISNFSSFNILSDEILSTVMKNPTKSRLDKVWHMFFATGEYKYQEICYQMMGHKDAKESLKKYSCDIYVNIKKLYKNEINELKKNSNWKHNDLSIIDFTYIEFIANEYISNPDKYKLEINFEGKTIQHNNLIN